MRTSKPTTRSRARTRAEATAEAPKKAGRHTLYTEELGLEICRRLSEGQSLREVCRDPAMPRRTTVRDWARDPNHPISAQYTRAREDGYLDMADEILEIADDSRSDFIERLGKDGQVERVLDREAIERSRLRIDARKWLLSKMLAKSFGDSTRLEHTGPDGQPIQIEPPPLSDFELARRVAFLLDKGRRDQEAAAAAAAANGTGHVNGSVPAGDQPRPDGGFRKVPTN